MAKSFKLSFLTNTSITHEVAEGHSFEFYPLRMGTYLLELRQIAIPVVKALSLLFGQEDNLRGSKETVHQASGEHGEFTQINENQPVDPTLWKQVEDQRTKSMSDAVEVLLSDETRLLLAKVILDSLRAKPQDFLNEVDKPYCHSVEDFCNNVLTTNMIGPFLSGVAKANAEIFSPLQKIMNMDQLTTSIANKLVEMQPEESPEETEKEKNLH